MQSEELYYDHYKDTFERQLGYLAERNKVDIVPIIIHGINHIFPRNTFCAYPGEATISIGKRIRANDDSWGTSYVSRTKNIHQYYIAEYQKLRQEKETPVYHRKLVEDQYRYKGIEVYSSIRKRMREYKSYAQWISCLTDGDAKSVFVINSGYGEFALLLALCHPGKQISAVESAEDKYLVAKYSSEGVVSNLSHYHANEGSMILNDCKQEEKVLFLLEPTPEDEIKYKKYNPIIIKKRR